MLDRVDAVAEALGEGLRSVVVVPVLDHDLSEAQRGPWVRHLVRSPRRRRPGSTHLRPAPLRSPAVHHVQLRHDGVPKCIVHGASGTLLQHAKEHLLHTDVRDGDVLFYFTTAGWMMWNWLVSGLYAGATVVLWDGSPVKPGEDALWRAAAKHGFTVFGTSPNSCPCVPTPAPSRTRLRLDPPADCALHRIPTVPRPLPLGLRRSGRRAAVFDLRRHRHHLLFHAREPVDPSTRARSRNAASAWPWKPGVMPTPPWSTRKRSWSAPNPSCPCPWAFGTTSMA